MMLHRPISRAPSIGALAAFAPFIAAIVVAVGAGCPAAGTTGEGEAGEGEGEGGGPGPSSDITQTCDASDLMLAVENGDAFQTPSDVIGGSDTGVLCRTPQSVCAQGDVVGLFPSLAHDATGAHWALSYLDTHFGFADKDIHASDMEI